MSSNKQKSSAKIGRRRGDKTFKLFYDFLPGKGIVYENPQSISHENEDFSMTLEEGKVTFSMKRHIKSGEVAREIVRKFIEAWRISVFLDLRSSEPRFKYRGLETIPDPGEPKEKGVEAKSCLTVETSLKASYEVIIRKNGYPHPPDSFEVTPDVRSMWERYNQYRRGNETLASMAYFCLTIVRYKMRGVKNVTKEVAASLLIDREILDWIGYLSSEVGDALNARKRNVKEFRPFTQEEKVWLEEAVRLIIRRAGEVGYPSNKDVRANHLKFIRMEDLPPL